ncbi:MAG: NAD(P)H-binding protein [Anaerolineae bacterium]|nr:NAD(P)H-binding protein [Anaerolineae bacterium]
MKLSIFGATGRTGQHLVRQALSKGYEVVALVRTPAKLDIQHEDLTVIVGDVTDLASVTKAVTGAWRIRRCYETGREQYPHGYECRECKAIADRGWRRGWRSAGSTRADG